MTSFWAMGGYAAFVWPAFVLTVLVLVFLLVASARTLKANESLLSELERTSPNPKKRSNGASTQT